MTDSTKLHSYKMLLMRMKTIHQTSMLLCGLIILYCQISNMGAEDVYIAEVMIEGNSTLDVSAFLSALSGLTTDTATILEASLIAQCEIIGEETTCWCEPEYIWSDLVCDSVNICCNSIKCVANISNFTPLCVPRVNVTIFGMIDIVPWPDFTSALESKFKNLNGFNGLSIAPSGPNFTVQLSATFQTSKIQDIISALKISYPTITDMNVTSIGLVSMEIPTSKVCYNSKYAINCSIEEEMNTCSWWISRPGQSTQIVGPGTEVSLVSTPTCTDRTSINLLNITLFWAGTYSCLLSKGSVFHSASANLQVALLPEVINITSVPQTPDCTTGKTSVEVNVSCSIYLSNEEYTVTINGTAPQKTTGPNNIANYAKNFAINCKTPQIPSVITYCNITNSLGQTTTAILSIPVIYPGNPFCAENGPWPKTKNGTKATIFCTEPGRIGIKERACNGNTWGDIVDLCIKQALDTMSAAAGDFEKGVGATEEGATLIFDNLKNNTVDGNSYGDVKTTVNVFNTMSRASNKIPLGEAVLPNFLDSASNILNATWSSDPSSGDLAASYLSSVEELVKNIQLNTSDGHNTSNIQLQVCRKASVCNRTVFNVAVEVNSSSFEVKTMGLQNIAPFLPKGTFQNSLDPSLVVSATVNDSGTVNIRLAFPTDSDKSITPHCVWWNFTEGAWSEEGCNYTQISSNMSTCECDHLTSFAMLMSRTPIDLPFLDQITYIGLGISICSLVVFILIEFLVWNAVVKTNLSHFRHTALVNISLCLLLADCSFVMSTFKPILTSTLCLILVMAKHFFYLAMFFWMLCLSIMLLHQLIFVFHPLRKKIYMLLSITIGYACPTVTVGATYLYYDKRTDVSYYTQDGCWLTYASPMKGSIHAFLLPVGIIVFINMFSMVVVITMLLKPSAADNNKKDDKETAKSIIKVIIFLTPVFGGTWILGLFVFLMNDNSFTKVLINYAFTIVNSLQGFFILLTGCFGEKRVRDEIIKLVISRKSAKSESKKNLTSSYGKN